MILVERYSNGTAKRFLLNYTIFFVCTSLFKRLPFCIFLSLYFFTSVSAHGMLIHIDYYFIRKK